MYTLQSLLPHVTKSLLLSDSLPPVCVQVWRLIWSWASVRLRNFLWHLLRACPSMAMRLAQKCTITDERDLLIKIIMLHGLYLTKLKSAITKCFLNKLRDMHFLFVYEMLIPQALWDCLSLLAQYSVGHLSIYTIKRSKTIKNISYLYRTHLTPHIGPSCRGRERWEEGYNYKIRMFENISTKM